MMLSSINRYFVQRHRDLIKFDREKLLQAMFYESARAAEVELPPLYPVGAAANYGLLYLVLRILTENPVRRVLDVGAGQTSLLLSAISKTSALEVVTIESDQDWAKRIRTVVEHQVIHCPLETRVVSATSADVYSKLEQVTGQFDLIIVDGPMGSDTCSRWGAIDLVDRFKHDDYIVIFDDAERRGEQDTISEFLKKNNQLIEGVYFPPALKQQFVAFTKAFSHIKYYGWN